MLNDRDNQQYENPEESEYHFTDDEVSYEVEAETPKASAEEKPKVSLIARLSQSRRMLISLGIFLVLVFVVYKMVTPGTSTAPPNITPVTAENARQLQTPIRQQPASPPTTATPAVAVPPPLPTNIIPTNTPPPPTTAAATQTVTTPPAPIPTTTPPVTSAAPPVVASMPPVIPVQSVTRQVPTEVSTEALTKASNLATPTAISDAAVAQLRSEYLQKLNDFATQNQSVQSQIELLNTRVANIEAQMTKLIQALTQSAPRPEPVRAPPVDVIAPQVQTRFPYNVQAIIPGRAWLRADNGETLTVAEGDMIKNLGRVTKIDPYDGIVEINTGTKVISLSYGNGN